MNKTTIAWTDATWNPTRGCTRVSEGCRNCYAERMAHRFSRPEMPYGGLTQIANGHPQWTGKVILDEKKLLEPLRWRKPRRVFVNSMSDLFHEALPFHAIDRVWQVMLDAPQHTYQILTKRAERMTDYFAHDSVGGVAHQSRPPDWIHLGVSVEDQKTVNERVPRLLQTPAAKRFVSYEPALGPVDFSAWIGVNPNVRCPVCERWMAHDGYFGGDVFASCCGMRIRRCTREEWLAPIIDQIIVGGESGHGARPCRVEWIESAIAQCNRAGVRCFVKQLGSSPVWAGATSLPIAPARGKCDDPAEWPEELRVRELIEAR